MLLRLILSIIVLLGFAFVVFRVIVRNDYLKKGKLSFVSYSLEFLIFALHANAMYLYIPVTWPELPRLPDPTVLNILTRVFLYAGLIIVFVAIAGLGVGPTMGQDKRSLRKSGLYRFSRNPQVIGYGLILISFILCYPSLYAVGWFLLFVLMISLMIKTEEEFLMKTYGEEYQHYRREVRRIL
jgi:protein-S-isoprenylcysteine O-methyltransferase Ste14